MLTKTFTFTDLDGNERVEEHCFHLTKAKLFEMELSTKGGLDKYISRIVMEQDNTKLVELFKDLIKMSYGKKSDDGRRFIQSDEIFNEFAQTEAYSQLFMELATNADAASAFVNGIVPPDIAQAAGNIQIDPKTAKVINSGDVSALAPASV